MVLHFLLVWFALSDIVGVVILRNCLGKFNLLHLCLKIIKLLSISAFIVLTALVKSKIQIIQNSKNYQSSIKVNHEIVPKI